MRESISSIPTNPGFLVASDLYRQAQGGKPFETLEQYLLRQIKTDLLESLRLNFSSVLELNQHLPEWFKDFDPSYVPTIQAHLNSFFGNFGISCRIFDYLIEDLDGMINMLVRCFTNEENRRNKLKSERAKIELVNFIKILVILGLKSLDEIVALIDTEIYSDIQSLIAYSLPSFHPDLDSCILEVSPPIGVIGQTEYMLRCYQVVDGKLSVKARSLPKPIDGYYFGDIEFCKASPLIPENVILSHLKVGSEKDFDIICDQLIVSGLFQNVFEDIKLGEISPSGLVDLLSKIPTQIVEKYIANPSVLNKIREILNCVQKAQNSEDDQLTQAGAIYDQIFAEFFPNSPLEDSKARSSPVADDSATNSPKSPVQQVVSECRTQEPVPPPPQSSFNVVQRPGDEFSYDVSNSGVKIYEKNGRPVGEIGKNDPRFKELYEAYACGSPHELNGLVRKNFPSSVQSPGTSSVQKNSVVEKPKDVVKGKGAEGGNLFDSLLRPLFNVLIPEP